LEQFACRNKKQTSIHDGHEAICFCGLSRWLAVSHESVQYLTLRCEPLLIGLSRSRRFHSGKFDPKRLKLLKTKLHYCYLLRICSTTSCTTNPQQIELAEFDS